MEEFVPLSQEETLLFVKNAKMGDVDAKDKLFKEIFHL